MSTDDASAPSAELYQAPEAIRGASRSRTRLHSRQSRSVVKPAVLAEDAPVASSQPELDPSPLVSAILKAWAKANKLQSASSNQLQQVSFWQPQMLTKPGPVWVQAENQAGIAKLLSLPVYGMLLKPTMLKSKQGIWRQYMYPPSVPR